jgi:hypothetical protein
VNEGVEITLRGVELFKKYTDIDVVGGKYCGYVAIDNSQEIIDRCQFLYWCEKGHYQSNESFFGNNHILSFPTSFSGNSFVRLSYLKGIPEVDKKKKYLKYLQPIYSLLSYYKLRQLYRNKKIISIQEHISPATSAGTVQSANIVSDMLSLKKIFTFLKSRCVWYATCEEISRYIYIRNNSTIQWDQNTITIDFKNLKNLFKTFISITNDTSFTLQRNGVQYKSTWHNKFYVVTVPVTSGINEFTLLEVSK